MGSSYQGDIPGNIFYHSMAYASLASNGTDRALPFAPPTGHPIEILSAWVEPHASQAGSASHYPDVKLINIGTGSAGTAVLANRAYSATGQGHAALTLGSMALGSVASINGTDRIAASHEQVGNGLDLVAHNIHIAYRYK